MADRQLTYRDFNFGPGVLERLRREARAKAKAKPIKAGEGGRKPKPAVAREAKAKAKAKPKGPALEVRRRRGPTAPVAPSVPVKAVVRRPGPAARPGPRRSPGAEGRMPPNTVGRDGGAPSEIARRMRDLERSVTVGTGGRTLKRQPRLGTPTPGGRNLKPKPRSGVYVHSDWVIGPDGQPVRISDLPSNNKLKPVGKPMPPGIAKARAAGGKALAKGVMKKRPASPTAPAKPRPEPLPGPRYTDAKTPSTYPQRSYTRKRIG